MFSDASTKFGTMVSTGASNIGDLINRSIELGFSGSLSAVRTYLGELLWNGFWDSIHAIFSRSGWDVLKFAVVSVYEFIVGYLKIGFSAIANIGSTISTGLGLAALIALFTRVSVVTGGVTKKVNALKYIFQTRSFFVLAAWGTVFKKFFTSFGLYIRFFTFPLEKLFSLAKAFLFVPKLLTMMANTRPGGAAANPATYSFASAQVTALIGQLFSLNKGFESIKITLLFAFKWLFGLNMRWKLLRISILLSLLAIKHWWSGFIEMSGALGEALKMLGGYLGRLGQYASTFPWDSIASGIGTAFGHLLLMLTHITNRLLGFREWLSGFFENENVGTAVFAGLIAAFVGALAFMRYSYKKFLLTTFVAAPPGMRDAYGNQVQQIRRDQATGAFRRTRNLYNWATRKDLGGSTSATELIKKAGKKLSTSSRSVYESAKSSGMVCDGKEMARNMCDKMTSYMSRGKKMMKHACGMGDIGKTAQAQAAKAQAQTHCH